MSNCCDLKNPLLRDGVSQNQRQTLALSPSYVQVDERELEDFLVFAHQLAQQIIYYDLKNQSSGHWQAFWQGSTPVWLALISKTRPQAVKQAYDQHLQSFLSNRSSATFALVLESLTHILTQIKQWHQSLEPYTPFKSILKGLIKTNLSEPLIKLWAFELAYVSQIGQGTTAFDYQGFADTFNLEIISVSTPDFTPLDGTLLEVRRELDGVFQVLWQNYRQIIQLAPQYLGQSLEARQDHQPYLALYFAFLEVFKPARDDLNRMTQRHLDFFYRHVLRLPSKPSQPDQAHLIFELARSQTEYKLKANTLFKAGKDALELDLFYKLDQDIIVHKEQISSFKGLLLDSQEIETGEMPRHLRGLLASPQANSLDGKGEDFPKDQPVKAWFPFGHEGRDPARLGLAISSDVLLLQEGKRTITIQLTLRENQQDNTEPKFSDIEDTDELLNLFTINLTGKKGLIKTDISSLQLAPLTSSENNTYLLTLNIELSADIAPVIPYNHDLHGLSLDTKKPVCLLQLNSNKNNQIDGLNPYHFLRPLTLIDLTVTTTVDKVRNLVLQNDLAVIDPSKPFTPFGPQPVVGSTFYIGSQEILQKNLSSLKLDIDWEGLPKDEDLTQYDLQFISVDRVDNVEIADSPANTNQVTITKIDDFYQAQIFNSQGNLVINQVQNEFQPDAMIAEQLEVGFRGQLIDQQIKKALIENIQVNLGYNYLAQHYRGYYVNGEIVDGKTKAPQYFSNFATKVERLTQSSWSNEGLIGTYKLFDTSSRPQELIKQEPIKRTISGEEIAPLTDFNLQSRNGFLRLTLNQDLLHDEFPRKYAVQVLAAAKDFEKGEYVNQAVYEVKSGNSSTITSKRWTFADPFDANSTDITAIPVTLKEPYTPTIRSIALSYTAIANKGDCQLFHLYPFDGYQSLTTETTPYLLPQFSHEGELFLGLEDLEAPIALPLLFQVAEETANTDLARANVEWYYLKDNIWQQLEDHQILSDTTKGLIASGIVNLAIPSDISKDKTTILDPKFYWLKVSIAERSKAICQMIGVHTQAARVTFTDRGNDPNHLATPIARGTIAKLVTPQPQIKKIEQPYDSFGGQVAEQSKQFYTRISEHLRHKGRAVTIFDYERLVLEKFTQIYKVRCINHGQVNPSGQLQELMPGAVTLAVIRDLSLQPTTNNLEPKVNINLLQEIEMYLSKLCSSWVEIRAVNPQYQRIRVKFQVQFKEPYQANFGYYRRQLERDIIGFLSPWTVDKGAEINFGGKVYRSSILNFVEEQDYVDYLVNFEMDLDGQLNLREAVASTAHSILVSVPFADREDQGHIIKPIGTHPPNQPIVTSIGNR